MLLFIKCFTTTLFDSLSRWRSVNTQSLFRWHFLRGVYACSFIIKSWISKCFSLVNISFKWFFLWIGLVKYRAAVVKLLSRSFFLTLDDKIVSLAFIQLLNIVGYYHIIYIWFSLYLKSHSYICYCFELYIIFWFLYEFCWYSNLFNIS